MRNGRVLTLGEAMVAVTAGAALEVSATAELSVAGAESNVATGLSRLGHPVDFASAVGADQLGALIRRSLAAEGIGVSGLEVDAEAPSGAIFFDRAPGGAPRVNYLRSHSAFQRYTAAGLPSEEVAKYSLVHLTGITLALGQTPRASALRVARAAQAAGVPVSFDINYRSRLVDRETAIAQIAEMLPMVSILIASEDELPLLDAAADAEACAASTPETALAPHEEERLVGLALAAGVEQVVVKRGESGASAFTASERASAAPYRVEVVSVVGAGDAFCAGYLSGMLDGLPLAERLVRGNQLGACAVTSSGDWEGLPYRADLRTLGLAPGEVQR